MPPESSERRLAAILCADAVGFSRRMEADETGTLTLLHSLREEVFDPAVKEHCGRVFKLTGDGSLIEFGSVVESVECALDIQRRLRERNARQPPNRRLEFRIGVNLGDVVFQGGDIYGDGVNVAARLESVARPGGIALSDTAFRHVMGKIVTVFEDSGFRSLKNITEPVHVYRWPQDASNSTASAVQAGTGLPVSRRPAVCVRPFREMTSAAQQELLGDGVAEDIIYGISRFSSIDVIGRCSAFADRIRELRVQELREAIGARYAVDGSVRRNGNRVRVSVELTGCKSGIQIWAGRYDREFTDIFAIEDEIVEEIVAALPGQILKAEQDRVRRKPPADMSAYEHVIAGRLYHHMVRPEENRLALEHLAKAIELDPGYADAYAWRACTLGQSIEFGFSGDDSAIEEEAFEMINTALRLDENHLECHRLLAEVCMMTGQLDQAETHNERALSMNSFDPRLLAQKGEVLTWKGEAAAGTGWIKRAMRLDPFGAPGRAHLLGNALYSARNYQEAIVAYNLIPAPSFRQLAVAAAANAKAGSLKQARRLAAQVLRQAPEFSVEKFTAALPFCDKENARHVGEGLKLAGLPD